MGSLTSCLHVGSVAHRRFRPRQHKLRYAIFMMLIDLDDLGTLDADLKLFSCNRFNVFSLREADYGPVTDSDPGARSLRQRIDTVLADAGLDIGGGSVRLMTMPRMLGYAFNPLSIYFCYAKSGALRAVLYEVRNTFGDKHTYLIEVPPGTSGTLTQACDKVLHVSPFLDMAMRYRFHVKLPAETFAISILDSDADGPILSATMATRQRPLTDRELLAVFFRFPLMTLKVMAGIHLEALWLWLKGIPLHRRPAPPAKPVSSIRI